MQRRIKVSNAVRVASVCVLATTALGMGTAWANAAPAPARGHSHIAHAQPSTFHLAALEGVKGQNPFKSN